MTQHDGLPRHPTPEELRVAQGEKGSDSKGINDHCIPQLPATLPKYPTPADDASSPQPAPHRPETLSNISSDDGDGCEDDSDLFLGSGPSIRGDCVSVDCTNNTTPASPTLALQRNNGLSAATSGLLNLHDAGDEVYLLLDRLGAVQDTLKLNEKESMYQNGRACALADVQEGLLRRSELLHVGTAEGRILRREAARLDEMRAKAYKETPKALEMSKGLENPALVAGKLHEAIIGLLDEAHAALQTVKRLTGQAVSDPTSSGTAREAAMQTAQYPEWKDHHLVSLTTERRVLKSQTEELERVNKKQRGDISRPQRQVDDELQARQSAAITPWRDVPQSLVPGPPVLPLNLQPVQGEPAGIRRASAPWNFT